MLVLLSQLNLKIPSFHSRTRRVQLTLSSYPFAPAPAPPIIIGATRGCKNGSCCSVASGHIYA